MSRTRRTQLGLASIGRFGRQRYVHRQSIALVVLIGFVVTSLPSQSRAGDPTAPPAAMLAKPEAAIAERPPETLRLQAIFVSEGRRVALVNGERLREGDQIGRDLVGRIQTNAVELYRDDEVIELRLVSENIKRVAPPGERNHARQGPTQ